MARLIEVSGFDEGLRKRLIRSFQSGNITFLLGSGASLPAIPTAGNVEAEIANLLSKSQDQKAYSKLYDVLSAIQGPTNRLIGGVADAANEKTRGLYEEFLRIVEEVLIARRTNLLPRQVTIFTTNYDLFIEQACASTPTVILNDGFSRSPGLGFGMEYSSRNFFRTIYNTGNLYDYKVEIPCINLIKLHGSLSWTKGSPGIALRVGEIPLLPEGSDDEQKKAFVNSFAVVLPQAAKFRETLMDRTYYDLLRIYANALDRENTVMLVFGFSFGDEHILDITTRALKNPTLRLMIFAFSAADRDAYAAMFEQYSNVEVISDSSANLDFERFNMSLRQVLHAPQVPA